MINSMKQKFAALGRLFAVLRRKGSLTSGDRILSNRDLYLHISKVASGYDSLGIQEDDCVAVMLRNDFAFFEACMAATVVGAYAVPVNWHNTAEEVAYILGDCKASILVIHADLLVKVRSVVSPEVKLLVVETPPEIRDAYNIPADRCHVSGEDTNWDSWRGQQKSWMNPPKAYRGSMMYTSGTTGQPKGVKRAPFTDEHMLRAEESLDHVFELKSAKTFRTIVTGPLYHVAPYNLNIFGAIFDVNIVLQPKFDPEELLQLIEQHKITHIHLVPIMFVRLLQLDKSIREKYDLSSLRWIVHGAAPCPLEVKQQMLEWWGPIVNEYYGGTEGGFICFLKGEYFQQKLGSVGQPVPGVELKILQDGVELAPNETGDIYLKNSNISDFHYFGKAKSLSDLTSDGYVSLGDVGHVDDDGFLFMTDRKTDMIISGGVNIYPAEIEAALITIEGVEDCAVFGIPDTEFGEAVCAYIQPGESSELTKEGLQELLREKISGFKVPRHIEFRTDLPREDSGKIFKRKLKDPYWQQTDRNI